MADSPAPAEQVANLHLDDVTGEQVRYVYEGRVDCTVDNVCLQ